MRRKHKLESQAIIAPFEPKLFALAAAAALALAACGHREKPTAAPHYLVGAPYQLDGTWYYPQESFRYDETGLAVRLPDRIGLTADAEAFDPTAMAGAHQTLQLPAIALVTNLENGRQIRIRLNDRGPANPGRLIGLTRRAADLLGLPPNGAAQVRVEVQDVPSQALRDQLHAGPAGITAAPVGAVTAETLPPPGSTRTPTPAQAPPRVAPPPPAIAAEASVPDRLPATFAQGSPRPGRLWLRAGQFSQAVYANTVKADLSALPVEIRREGEAHAPRFVVMAGPFASVAEADAALDQARRAGVTDAVIVVE